MPRRPKPQPKPQRGPRPARNPSPNPGPADPAPRSRRDAAAPLEAVAEVLPGLKAFAMRELHALPSAAPRESRDEDEIPFAYRSGLAGLVRALPRLRTSVAVSARLVLDVPRPKALLGDAHLRRLVAFLTEVRDAQPEGTFTGFRFRAAGAESAVFRRLAAELERPLGLPHDDEDGDFVLRVRPAGREDGPAGWEVLARLTPRPLSARAWRVCNMSGGLNAAVAAAMNDMAGVRADDRYLNLMCGSGTLLAERFLVAPAARLVGIDDDPDALACARRNVEAAGGGAVVELAKENATRLPFADGSFDVVVADAPWGDAVGSHHANASLYEALLAEAARVTARGARMVLLTHELRIAERLLGAQREWRVRNAVQVFHGGHRPRMYALERR